MEESETKRKLFAIDNLDRRLAIEIHHALLAEVLSHAS